MSRRSRYLNSPLSTSENFLQETSFSLPSFSFQFWIIFFFHLLLLTVPLFFTWVNEELFEFNKIILVYAYTIIIGSLWVGRMIAQKKLIWKRTIFDFPILFFLISQLLSTLFSINFHTSIFGYYTRFNGGLLSTISYITLFYAFINNIEKKDLSKIFFSTFLSSFFVSMMAIPEHFGHSFSCLLIGVNRGMPISGQIYDTSCWIQDVQTRVFASFGQPNWLAAYAITLIPLGSLLASGRISIEDQFKVPAWQKWFYLVATLALVLDLIFTKSRSGFLGLFVGLAFGGAVLVSRQIATKRSLSMSNQLKMFFLLQVALLIGAICLFGSPYSPSVFDLMTRKQAATTPAQSLETTPAPVVNRLDEGGTDSGDIRRIVWTGAIKVWERYPILGSGVETFAYSYYKDRPMAHNLVSEWDFLYNKAHNEFLNFLATTGIVGLLTYLFLLGAIVFAPGLPESAFNFFHKKRLTLLNFKELNEEQKNALFIVGMALSSGVVALSVSNFFGFSTVMVSLLLLLFPAFWVVFAQKKNEASQTLEKLPTTFSMTQVVLLCLLFFVSLTLIFHVYEMWEADRIFAKGKQNSEANQVNVGLPLLEQAVSIAPDEPYFSDELAVTDARVAAALGTNGSATEAAQFAQRSIELSNQTLEMNNVNLNFYKSQARVYSLLAQLDPKFIQNALKTLNKARELAPTDPKLQYNVSVLELNFGNPEQGYKDLIRSIEMKPNYIQARLNLGEYYEAQGKIDLAKEQYEYILTKIQSNDVESLARMATLATMSAKTK